MKRKILSGIIVLMPFLVKAQFSITTLLHNNNILLKEQLWNVIIINNGNDIAELKLEVDVKDMLGQSVMNAHTNKFIAGKGAKMISVKEVQPLVYSYTANKFSGNYVPCGSYL